MELVETEMKHGTVEIECVVFRADGTVKSKETAIRNVRIGVDHGDQIVKIEEE